MRGKISATEAAKTTSLISGTVSEIAQALFKIKGEPLRYKDQNYLVTALDDTHYKTMLLKTGRQIGKSTALATMMLVPSICFPNYQTVYVSPSFKQTKEFSQVRVDPFLRDSTFVQQFLTDKLSARGIEVKTLTNGSRNVFKYAFYTADRVRGQSADSVFIDEAQNILWDNVPVIEQCLAHSKCPTNHPEWSPFYKRRFFSGTPLTLQNPMEYLWNKSTQCVWVIPCRFCGHWNQLTEKSIGKFGTICSNSLHGKEGRLRQCSHEIDPREGMWHVLKPESEILAFHISQLMAPRSEWGPHGWVDWKQDIIRFMDLYDKVRLYNEILGLPCDNALRALTQGDLMACCDEGLSFRTYPDSYTQGTNLWAGVDWGETNSRTVLTIGGYFPGDTRFSVVFTKVYGVDECEPLALVDDIAKWCTLFNVQGCGCDVGHGYGLYNTLMQKIGIEKVFPIRYMSSSASRLVFSGGTKYEWQANRTQVLAELFTDIRKRMIRFPRWAEFEQHCKDYLAIFAEYSPRSRQLIFQHNPDDPDDRVHSLNYARLAAELSMGNFQSWEV